MTRKSLRILLKVLIALQAIPFVEFLRADDITNAVSSAVLSVYMFLVLHFEGKSHELRQEKRRLEDFLNSIPDSEQTDGEK